MTKDALIYHEQPTPGKIRVLPSKPCATAADLSLAYTPGVALPCLEIKENPEAAYKYTAKGNLVAVITNGTAVLGLGDIGPLAGKPVMEGKAVLFKRFAGIDAFDIEINEKDPEKLVNIIASLEPTFGGINLEDIKAPECFYVEPELIKRMNIPVMHDDQHGTAIISGAALLNATTIAGKKINQIKVVFSGAGAAALTCAKMFCELGVQKSNLFIVDSKGVITTKRSDLNSEKKEFVQDTNATTLAEILHDADVFVGLSQGNILTADMLKTMNSKPIVFAMANPTPEISYNVAINAVPDIILATGRSDYPNQVNNVLGFPYLFRAALDTQSTTINKEMKLAAARGLASLAHKKVPTTVETAYGQSCTFGPKYIIPKPFDPRVLSEITPLIAKAAMETGVARKKIDLVQYKQDLKLLSKRLAKGKF